MELVPWSKPDVGHLEVDSVLADVGHNSRRKALKLIWASNSMLLNLSIFWSAKWNFFKKPWIVSAERLEFMSFLIVRYE